MHFRSHLLPSSYLVSLAISSLTLKQELILFEHKLLQECVVSNLLEQKKDIKRQNILLERMRAESEQEMAEARAVARERVMKEFETTQTGLGSKAAEGKVSSTGGQDKDGNKRGTKRAFELDEDEIERLTNEAIDEASKRMAKEMAEVRKSKLTNYWLVSENFQSLLFLLPADLRVYPRSHP
jgi:nitric oxide synthase-interacting protein